MTRYQFLRMLRHLIDLHAPGLWCTMMWRQEGGYHYFYVDLEDGSTFKVTIEKLR